MQRFYYVKARTRAITNFIIKNFLNGTISPLFQKFSKVHQPAIYHLAHTIIRNQKAMAMAKSFLLLILSILLRCKILTFTPLSQKYCNNLPSVPNQFYTKAVLNLAFLEPKQQNDDVLPSHRIYQHSPLCQSQDAATTRTHQDAARNFTKNLTYVPRQ